MHAINLSSIKCLPQNIQIMFVKWKTFSNCRTNFSVISESPNSDTIEHFYELDLRLSVVRATRLSAYLRSCVYHISHNHWTRVFERVRSCSWNLTFVWLVHSWRISYRKFWSNWNKKWIDTFKIYDRSCDHWHTWTNTILSMYAKKQ